MGSEYQALIVHSKSHSKSNKRRSHSTRGKHSHKDNTRKDLSRIICYTCDEARHYARNCPKKQKLIKMRNKLKNVKIQNAETIHSYFTRVSQIKEQLEAVDEEVENAEIVMTTLNGLPRSWDSFIQGICGRKKLVKFSRLWEE